MLPEHHKFQFQFMQQTVL